MHDSARAQRSACLANLGLARLRKAHGFGAAAEAVAAGHVHACEQRVERRAVALAAAALPHRHLEARQQVLQVVHLVDERIARWVAAVAHIVQPPAQLLHALVRRVQLRLHAHVAHSAREARRAAQLTAAMRGVQQRAAVP
jgi:hypothetical protein